MHELGSISAQYQQHIIKVQSTIGCLPEEIYWIFFFTEIATKTNF